MTAEQTSPRRTTGGGTTSTAFLAFVGASVAAGTMFVAVSALAGSWSGSIAATLVFALVITIGITRRFPRRRRLAIVIAALSVTVSLWIIAIYVMMLIFISGYT